MEAIQTEHIRKENLIERLVLNKFFWFALTLFFFAYPVLKSMKRELPVELPVLSTLPEFEFVNEDGRVFGSKDLFGKVYIMNLSCTKCEYDSSAFMAKMQKIQHRIRGVIDRAAIVTISIDPAQDVAPVLYNFAREIKSNPNVWKFVSAPQATTENFVLNTLGLKVDGLPVANLVQAAKSEKLVLVDQEGQIRGYYSSDNDGVNHLMIDLGLLINRKKKS